MKREAIQCSNLDTGGPVSLSVDEAPNSSLLRARHSFNGKATLYLPSGGTCKNYGRHVRYFRATEFG